MSAFQPGISTDAAIRHLHAGKVQEAEAICRQVLVANRNDHQALAVLGQVLTMQGRFDDAMEVLSRAVALAPREIDYHLLLAEAQATNGHHRDALSRYDKALKLDRTYPPAIAGKANVLARTAAWAKARALLEPSVARGTEDATIAVVYARVMIHEGEPALAVEVAMRHLGDPLRDEVRRSLLFEIARAHEKAGSYDDAFAGYAAANSVSPGVWDPVAESRRYDRVMATFTRDRIEKLPRPTAIPDDLAAAPVFLVGMLRSGSTLTEQIIDAHPKAHGAGELILIPELVETLGLRISSTLPYPECVADLDAADANGLAGWYLGELKKLAPADARRICDKYLGSYEHLGLLVTLFPKARIIHTRRDPVDTCLSCFVQKFAPGVPAYTEDLVHLGLLYNDYAAIMDHWRSVLPEGCMLEIDYEQTVADQETVSRKVIDFVGLEWDDRCLRFWETGREVITLSRDQVNKPIYSSSVGRAAKWGRNLDPLREVLERGWRGKDARLSGARRA